MHITPKGFKVFMATCHGEDNADEKRAARLGATKCRRHESRRAEGPQTFYSPGFVLGSFPYSRVTAKTAFILELATAILCSGLMEKMWYACWKWRSVRRQIKTEG